MLARTVLAALVTSVALVSAPVALADDDAQPPNVGDAKIAATEYHDSGAYMADLAGVAAQATDWIRVQAPTVARPAVVFDIDDTVLSNWEVIKANDFGRFINGPCELPGVCAWRPWDLAARSVVIPPTLDTFNTAKSSGAAVFFITGRDDGQRAATELNLASAGLTGYLRLIMAPAGVSFPSAADFKAPQRAVIEGEGYTIVANIGDQPSDLAGGHAQRTFQLPNPFYRIP